MRRLKKPPRHLKIEPQDAMDAGGGVVAWGSSSATKRFRRQFAAWAYRSQKGRCAYCSLPLGARGHRSSSIDHFVKKGGNNGLPRWTYELYNLFLACERCNSKSKKQYLALDGSPINPYRANAFTLFHPYLDKIQDHMEGGYRGGATEPSTPRHLSAKGAESIRLFKLADISLRRLWESESQACADDKRRRDLSANEYAQYREALKELQGAFR